MPSSLLTLARTLRKRRQLERSCRWSRAQLLEHQQRSVASLRQFARLHSPFYQRFHQGMENQPLIGLPVLTKAILMENFDSLVTDPGIRRSDAEAFLASGPGARLFRDRYVVLATSGSTGLRGVFLFDPDEWLHVLASIIRPMHWAGVRPNPLHPRRTAMLASTTPWHYSARIGLSLNNPLIPTLRLDASEPLASMVRRLNEWQPEVMAAYPSVLRQLAGEQAAGRLRIPLRKIATSAEVLTHDVRRRVEQAWGVKMYDTYGATEYAPIAAECEYGGKHLFEDGALIEIADERGPVPPGVAGSRVLITVFHRRTQPLIRYEISDMVRSVEGQCACGRPFQLIDAVEGRIEDVLTLPSRHGATVSIHPNAFERLLETAPAAGWQVIQDGAGLRVNLAGLRDPAFADGVRQSISSLLEAEGAAPVLVSVRAVAELERGATGKAPLISARKVGAA